MVCASKHGKNGVQLWFSPVECPALVEDIVEGTHSLLDGRAGVGSVGENHCSCTHISALNSYSNGISVTCITPVMQHIMKAAVGQVKVTYHPHNPSAASSEKPATGMIMC